MFYLNFDRGLLVFLLGKFYLLHVGALVGVGGAFERTQKIRLVDFENFLEYFLPLFEGYLGSFVFSWLFAFVEVALSKDFNKFVSEGRVKQNRFLKFFLPDFDS